VAELETGAVVGGGPNGNYIVVSLLGIGGMGAVYRVRDTRDESLCAIKVLRRARDADDALVTRFLREARIASALAHPNIARVHEVLQLEPDGAPAIVMELLEGESLGARFARTGKLPPGTIARICLDVVHAVRAAHERGVVHRDLKPDNIFLCEDGSVKVLDFGIAKVALESTDPAITAAELTETGQILGTPQYMAPEQIFGEKDIDARADIWALGVILYQALAGVRPFDGENPGQVFKAIALEPPTPLSKSAPARTPKELTDLVSRMLVHSRADRLADLGEVERVLEKVIAADQLGDATTLHAEESLPLAPPRAQSNRRRLLVLGAVVIAAVGTLASVPSLLTNAPPSRAPDPPPVVTMSSAVSRSSNEEPAPKAPPDPPPPTTTPPPPTTTTATTVTPKIAATAPPRTAHDSGTTVDAGATKTNRSGPLSRDEF